MCLTKVASLKLPFSAQANFISVCKRTQCDDAQSADLAHKNTCFSSHTYTIVALSLYRSACCFWLVQSCAFICNTSPRTSIILDHIIPTALQIWWYKNIDTYVWSSQCMLVYRSSCLALRKMDILCLPLMILFPCLQLAKGICTQPLSGTCNSDYSDTILLSNLFTICILFSSSRFWQPESKTGMEYFEYYNSHNTCLATEWKE